MAFFNKKTFIYFFVFCTMLFFYNCKKEHAITKQQSTLLESYIQEGRNENLSIEERKTNLEEAYKLVSKLDNSLYKVDNLQEIASAYYYLKNYSQLKKINKKALALSTSLSDSVGMAKSYGYKAIFFRNKKLDSAYKYFYIADKIYRSLDRNKNVDPLEYAFDHGRILIDLAKLSRKVKDYNNSEALTIKAIEKFKLSGNHTYLPLCYNTLGIIAKYLERYDDAIVYHQKAIEYAKNTKKDTLYTIVGNNNIGTVYKSQKKYKKAKEYYKKGLAYTKFLSSRPKQYARLLDNLAYVNFLSGDTDNLPNDFLFPLEIRERINDNVGMSTNYLHLAEYYQSINNNNLSVLHAEKAKNISLEIKDHGELLQSYQLLAQVSKPDERLEYALKYIKLSDSLTKRDNLFRDKFARIRFETKEKEQQIKQGDQKIKQGEQKILEVQNQNTIYFLGILLLITFIGFIIYFSRQRTRYLSQQNKIVQFQAAYETETRISKRLHDELGNDIFQVMLQYQNDPKDPHIPEKLNTAYTKARDISRENNDFEVGTTYPEEVSNMLQNYTQNGIQLILRGFDTMHWDDTDKTIKITVYRVLQELMTNMQKHSNASIVAIVFSNSNNILNIKYSDNGSGISQAQLLSKNGLRNTEKRIQAVHGTIIFDSEKDKGFKAEIKIPS